MTKLTKKEKLQLVLELVALTTNQRAGFMAANGMPVSLSNKGQVRERVADALEDGEFGYEAIIAYLDSVVPWGKQHVYLFKGPKGSLTKTWKKKVWVMDHLKSNAAAIHELVGAPAFVGLPDELTPTSVDVTSKRFAIDMVRRREWFEREPEFDESSETLAGEPVELRAFVHRVVRNFVAFEWDLTTNTAMLRISQLAGGVRYENVKQEFATLVNDWLDLATFAIIDLHPSILKLLELEKKGSGITRAHDYEVLTTAGRSVSSSSYANDVSVFGEKLTDEVYNSITSTAVGNVGNFFWLPRTGNPLSEDLRVVLVGSKDRVNFTAPSNEKIVRSVLSDIRKHCR
ncbi:hypothetical protein [Allorhodopirellula heiligendammensis]|uniref:Uncharacterized protein n=1 Tax=Allorhodopirellula heiligendammensis TaxID=2714739 RepID=A0A5C6BDM6_9BACT|nr:hypothetical protein [Allorhodopirellula heiligendammensis]TWU09727.1 hypothetical protein Poly21_55320 [Allorhodopirellula heiligendammensis]